MDQTMEELKDYLIKEVLSLANIDPGSLYRHPSVTEIHTGLQWVTDSLNDEKNLEEILSTLRVLSTLKELIELKI